MIALALLLLNDDLKFHNNHEKNLTESLTLEQKIDIAKSLFDEGKHLGDKEPNKREISIEFFNKVIDQFYDEQSIDVNFWVAKSLFYKGLAFQSLGRSYTRKEMEAYNKIIERFGDKPELQEWVGKSLINIADIKSKSGNTDEALNDFDVVIKRFGDNPKGVFEEIVARAYFSKGITFESMWPRKIVAAFAAYDEAFRRFRHAEMAEAREVAGMALFNKASRLSRLGNSNRSETVSAWDDIYATFSSETEVNVRKLAVFAAHRKGGYLLNLIPPDREAALSTFNDVIIKFKADREPNIEQSIATSMFERAEIIWWKSDIGSDDSIYFYDELIEYAQHKPHLNIILIRALIAKAEILTKITTPKPVESLEIINNIIKKHTNDPSEKKYISEAFLLKAEIYENSSQQNTNDIRDIYINYIRLFKNEKERSIQKGIEHAKERLKYIK